MAQNSTMIEERPKVHSKNILRLAFVSTAYNEEGNIREFYQRCHRAFMRLCQAYANSFDLEFRFIIADNGSTDSTLSILQQISAQDSSVILLSNSTNYGPEASAANALLQAGSCDFCILLCSDLQDPPELAISMIESLIARPKADSILAVKTRSAGSPFVRLARHSYYKFLDYSSRLQSVPRGFHGFGCYRQEVIQEALRYWNNTDLNLRQCLANACQAAIEIDYVQADRRQGKSSYGNYGYWLEAARSLISGDATASRLALLIGCSGLLLAIMIAIMLLINYLRGASGYGNGIPTLMGLVLLSFALQLLMFALLSRQIEALRMGGLRPSVRFTAYTKRDN